MLKAADQGDEEAQFNLAHLYLNGLGVYQDFNEAFNWFLKAAQQDHNEAQYHVDAL